MRIEDEENKYNNVYISVDPKFHKRFRLANEEEKRILDRYDEECGQVISHYETEEERLSRIEIEQSSLQSEMRKNQINDKTLKRLLKRSD